MSELADLSSLILELVKHKISSITSASKMLEIARVPLSLYRQAQKIFKNEAQVRKIMQQLLEKQFYVKIVDEQSQKLQFSQTSPLVAQVYEASDKITFYLMQLNLRLLLLGFSVSSDDKNMQKSKQGMKKLIKNLQIDIVLSSQLTFSQIVIKQLEQYLQDFPHLAFLQQSLLIFQKCNIFHITQWLQNKIEQKRQAFEVKMKEEQTLLPDLENNHQIRSIRRKNTIKKDENKISNEIEEKNTMNSQIREASVKQLIANSRKSGNLGSSAGKINKFIFRSSKKPSIEICQRVQKQDTKGSSSKQKKMQQAKVSRFMVQAIHQDEETEQSRVLCRGTPPKKNRQCK